MQHEVATLGVGDVFGEIALVDSVPRTATVCSVGPVAVFSLAREPFMRFISHDAHTGVQWVGNASA